MRRSSPAARPATRSPRISSTGTIAARDSAVLTLSPRRLELEPGDLLAIPSETSGGPVLRRIERIDDAPTGRRIEASGGPAPGRPGSAAVSRSRAMLAVTAPAFPGAALRAGPSTSRPTARQPDRGCNISRSPPSPGPRRRSGGRRATVRWRCTARSTIRPASGGRCRRYPPGRSGASTGWRNSTCACAGPARWPRSARPRCSRARTSSPCSRPTARSKFYPPRTRCSPGPTPIACRGCSAGWPAARRRPGARRRAAA